MSTLSVLCVLQRENQLRQHTANALNLGLTPQQIIEVFIHVSYYGGVPTAFNAMGIAKEVFENKGVDFQPLLVHDPSDSPDDLYNRGVELREKYMGASYGGGRPEPVTQAERDFLRLTGEYYWGSVWTRPGIDLEARCICTLSALTALGREGPLESHVRAGLNIGFTPERIMEVFIHTSYYAGLPFVRAAMDVANRVFASK
jgi:4-carboxymuconolactone decarboxylase